MWTDIDYRFGCNVSGWNGYIDREYLSIVEMSHIMGFISIWKALGRR